MKKVAQITLHIDSFNMVDTCTCIRMYCRVNCLIYDYVPTHLLHLACFIHVADYRLLHICLPF